jgi:hypothetical protein
VSRWLRRCWRRTVTVAYGWRSDAPPTTTVATGRTRMRERRCSGRLWPASVPSGPAADVQVYEPKGRESAAPGSGLTVAVRMRAGFSLGHSLGQTTRNTRVYGAISRPLKALRIGETKPFSPCPVACASHARGRWFETTRAHGLDKPFCEAGGERSGALAANPLNSVEHPTNARATCERSATLRGSTAGGLCASSRSIGTS